MSNQIITFNGVTMSSVEIAKLTSKEHKNVLRDIRVMLDELNGSDLSHNSFQEFKDNRGYTSEFQLDKELTLTLVSGYSIKVRHAIIKRWQELESMFAKPTAELPYHIRRYLANAQNVPKGHFAVLPEMCIRLIFPLDRVGYHLPENMLPDISFGKLFCKHLRDDHNYNTDVLPKYTHKYEDGRVVKPKCYPNEIYAIAIRYLDDTWMPAKACDYFQARDKESLQFVSKAFGLLKYEGESEGGGRQFLA